MLPTNSFVLTSTCQLFIAYVNLVTTVFKSGNVLCAARKMSITGGVGGRQNFN